MVGRFFRFCDYVSLFQIIQEIGHKHFITKINISSSKFIIYVIQKQ